MSKNYDRVLDLCKVVIERDFRTCGLEDDVKKQIFKLVLEWERDKEIMGEKSIGGSSWLFSCVLAIANHARYYSKGDEKLRCCKLKEKLKKGELGRRFRTKYWEIRK